MNRLNNFFGRIAVRLLGGFVVIWQGIAAPHAIDLKKFIKADIISEFFPPSIENNTVNGRLVSIPWFIDDAEKLHTPPLYELCRS